MIDLVSILKVAIPVAGSILLDDNISPIKQENPYRPIIKNAVDTTARVLDKCESRNNLPIQYKQSIQKITPFEIAESAEYKYTFK